MSDWTLANKTDAAREIDARISVFLADKHAHEMRVAELLNAEVAAEQAIVSAEHERDRAHELRGFEEELAREDQREIDELLCERLTITRGKGKA